MYKNTDVHILECICICALYMHKFVQMYKNIHVYTCAYVVHVATFEHAWMCIGYVPCKLFNLVIT